jgi:hypothetical protein
MGLKNTNFAKAGVLAFLNFTILKRQPNHEVILEFGTCPDDDTGHADGTEKSEV